MDELALLSLLPHLHNKLAQSQAQHPHQPSPRSLCTMWNHKHVQYQEEDEDDDDSWEVRAFTEDTGSAMGTTWPPRSYSCTFCLRDFRSAQALGGHMNVHRRDRARLHQLHHHPNPISFNSPSDGGLCLLYQLQDYPNHNGTLFPSTSTITPTSIAPNLLSNIVETSSLLPSSVLSVNPLRDYLMTSPASTLTGPTGVSSYVNNSHSHVGEKRLADEEDEPSSNGVADIEELDLELRLAPS